MIIVKVHEGLYSIDIAIQVYHIIDNDKIEVLSKNYNIMEIDASAKITKGFSW